MLLYFIILSAMVFWTLKWIIISVSLIFLVHHLFTFFKNTLTVPKIKDLVDQHDLYTTLLKNTVPSASLSLSRTEVSPAAISGAQASSGAQAISGAQAAATPTSLSTQEIDDRDSYMQTELQQFLKDLKKAH